ncbi:hypothetical protein HPB51_011909 [Rhipicephalus microplus]|uniref:Uncharacterized protein n=1 Tax=Rhipicephalus microplus TaxID=6941 RepID=A0A9J6ETK1_RHIMP|nr:hypothetical protein HPB51_011909 [Rhipicephalus microplus]
MYFQSTYTKNGSIERRLAWPLRKDDTRNREAFSIFVRRELVFPALPRSCHRPRCHSRLFVVPHDNVESFALTAKGNEEFLGEKSSRLSPGSYGRGKRRYGAASPILLNRLGTKTKRENRKNVRQKTPVPSGNAQACVGGAAGTPGGGGSNADPPGETFLIPKGSVNSRGLPDVSGCRAYRLSPRARAARAPARLRGTSHKTGCQKWLRVPGEYKEGVFETAATPSCPPLLPPPAITLSSHSGTGVAQKPDEVGQDDLVVDQELVKASA